MFAYLKKLLYFPIANYFKFFAYIRLKKWNPKIILVTGSNGKTTTLHLLESQFGNLARYSHFANSSFGIPFDILGLKRNTLFKVEWFGLILGAPFAVFKNIPKQKIYIVEADCDRPGEGNFLASLIKPHITIWLSSAKTHAVNFDHLVKKGTFYKVADAVANEFGNFLKNTSKLVIVNGDSALISGQLDKTKASIISIHKEKLLSKYSVSEKGTDFIIDGNLYKFNSLLPEEVFYSIYSVLTLCNYMSISFDQKFMNFNMPHGRGSIFEGISDTILFDSSYNSNLSSVSSVLFTYSKINSNSKWLVMGDMLEQGIGEKAEHEELARQIIKYRFKKIILMGPRVCEYTYPLLCRYIDKKIIEKFLGPRDTLDYIVGNINGNELILFKGARFMEGIIEHLLKNKKDINNLARREKIWEHRRKKWGL